MVPSPVTVPHEFVLGDYDAVEETRTLIREHAFGAILVEHGSTTPAAGGQA